jgi:hypothetical protein
MVKEKLVTLACVLGILACGACFLPPPRPYHPPPPPPLRPSLQGVRTIAIAVSNQSESRRMNPADLATMMTHDIQFSDYGSRITAIGEGVADPDAHLVVAIQKETLSQEQTGVRWIVSIDVLSTLTARDGSVLWSDSHVYSLTRPFPENEPDEVWQHIQIQNWLAQSLVTRMLRE